MKQKQTIEEKAEAKKDKSNWLSFIRRMKQKNALIEEPPTSQTLEEKYQSMWKLS
jgi:hypothetical protein